MKGTAAKKCCTCGKVIGEDNGIKVDTALSPSGWHGECKECTGKRFVYLSFQAGSTKEALYIMCAACDIPFNPMFTPKDKNPAAVWTEYLKSIDTRKRFYTGTTKVAAVFEDGDLPEPLAKEKTKEDLKREEWREKWGSGLSDEDYEELDRKYNVESHEFKGNITPRIEKNLIALSKLDVEFDKAMRTGDFDVANRITDIIKKTRDMESMKASDEKPAEEMRVDAIVDALERRGAMTDGTLCDRDTLLKWIADSTHIHYGTSLDIIDAVMLVAENARRRTDGERVLTEVPDYLQVTDVFGELETGMTDQEKAIMKELGKLPPRRERV